MSPRTKDETLAGGTAQGFRMQSKTNRSDCEPQRMAEQALKLIEGEQEAREYLRRLRTEVVGPDELAVSVAMLYGSALRGFCRVLAKALGGAHG